MKRSFKINTVIFDMDGVITDTMPCHFKAWSEIFKTHSIEVTHEDIYKREGQKGIESIREIFKEHLKTFNTSTAIEILKSKELLFKKIFKRKFITGSRNFIRDLAHRGFYLGLVTGTSRHEAKKLLPKSLWDLFNVTVCGSDVQNGKPHPEPYLKALSKLSIKASQAVVIENAPFGIRSAKAAGLTCLALETSLPKRFLTQADCVFDSYSQIKSNVSFIHYAKN